MFFQQPHDATVQSVLQHIGQLQPDVVVTTVAWRNALQSHAGLAPLRWLIVAEHSGAVVSDTDGSVAEAQNRAVPLDGPELGAPGKREHRQQPDPQQDSVESNPLHGSGAVQAAYKAAQACTCDDAVCIVCTSGSSGEPKYVVLGALSLLHRLAWHASSIASPAGSDSTPAGSSAPQSGTKPQLWLYAASVVAASSSAAFVDSIWQLLAPIAYGACPPLVIQSSTC